MTELFADRNTARRNLQRELDRVGTIVSKVEWPVAHIDDPNLEQPCREA